MCCTGDYPDASPRRSPVYLGIVDWLGRTAVFARDRFPGCLAPACARPLRSPSHAPRISCHCPRARLRRRVPHPSCEFVRTRDFPLSSAPVLEFRDRNSPPDGASDLTGEQLIVELFKIRPRTLVHCEANFDPLCTDGGASTAPRAGERVRRDRPWNELLSRSPSERLRSLSPTRRPPARLTGTSSPMI